MAFEVEQRIAAAPEAVFDILADARREPEWNSQVTRSELVSGEPTGVGSRFRTVNRGQVYDAVIARHERPQRLEYEVTGKAMDISATFTCVADAGATRFRGSFDMRPKGVLKLLFPVMGPMIRRDLGRQSANLKALAERSG